MEKIVPIDKNNKSLLRKEMLLKRRGFKGQPKIQADNEIASILSELTEYKNCNHLFLYASAEEEVDTFLLFEKAKRQNKKVYFPKVTGDDSMEFIEVNNRGQLFCGYKGILEPIGDEYTKQMPEIIIVPGVAFDKEFNRMGYGKGFYDRYLADKGKNALKIGICYDIQLLKKIPNEENDIQMDIIVTEKEIWKKKKDSLNI